MNKKKIISIGFCFAIAFTSFSFVFADENIKEISKNKIQKTYSYIAGAKHQKSEDIKDNIKYKGSKYKLDKIEYAPKKIEKTIKVENKDKEYKKEITKVIDGKEYKLKAAEEISWEKKGKKITVQEEREFKYQREIPRTIKKDGMTLSLKTVKESKRKEPFRSVATFKSYKKNADKYYFNGKLVNIANTPMWTGYKEDVKKYLGLKGSDYEVDKGIFTTENALIDKNKSLYERKAIFTGSRSTSVFTATYEYKGDIQGGDTTYVADIRYVSDDFYDITAVATYKKDNIILKVLSVSAGILVIAFAASLIIYMIQRRKKDK